VTIDAATVDQLSASLEKTVVELQRTGATEKELAKAKVLLTQLKNVGTALAASSTAESMPQSKRDLVFVNAAIALAGTFVNKGGDMLEPLAQKLETLAQQVQGKLSSDQQVKQFAQQAAELLGIYATQGISDKAQKKAIKAKIADLGAQLGTLARVLAGTASPDELDQMFSDAVVGLLERTAFSGPITPALFEGTLLEGATCSVFLSAATFGYGVAAPFGATLAKGLGVALNRSVKTDIASVLASKDTNWIETAAGGTPVIVSGKDRILGQYDITAFAYTDPEGKTDVFLQGVLHTSFFGFQDTFFVNASTILSGEK
jgi:type II secretory pathway component PulM